jgi:hypothetical protein
MNKILLILVVLVCAQSCVTQKRVHRRGYYVEWFLPSRSKAESSPNEEKIEDKPVEQPVEAPAEKPTAAELMRAPAREEKLPDPPSPDLGIYERINSVRTLNGLAPLVAEEALELASAQHGTWLALYNLQIDSNQVVLQSNEVSVVMTKKLSDPIDRVRLYTDREFFYIEECLGYFTQEPSTEDIYQKVKLRTMNRRAKFFGYWVIKYETPTISPIWYLVFIITD